MEVREGGREGEKGREIVILTDDGGKKGGRKGGREGGIREMMIE